MDENLMERSIHSSVNGEDGFGTVHVKEQAVA